MLPTLKVCESHLLKRFKARDSNATGRRLAEVTSPENRVLNPKAAKVKRTGAKLGQTK